MLTQIFVSVLLASCAGSVLAALLFLVKPLTRKYFGAGWQYYIWLAVLVAMLLPVRFHLPAGLPAANYVRVHLSGAAVTQPGVVQPSPAEGEPQSAGGAEKNRPKAWNRTEVMGLFWLAGAGIFLLVRLAGYLSFLRRVHKNTKPADCPELAEFTQKKLAVRSGGEIASPLMFGVFRSVLVLPELAMTKEELNNVLRHELTHFKRRDLWYKWFAFLVKCVHWFNPMIYLVGRQINDECEISCDLSVVRGMDKEAQTSYMRTILKVLSAGRSGEIALTTGMANSKKQLKRRFTMIQNRKQVRGIAVVLSVALAVAALGATVLASGVAAGGIFNSSATGAVEVRKNDEILGFTNAPYVDNGTIYLPLRETLMKFMDFSDGQSEILWGADEKIELNLYDKGSEQYDENGGLSGFTVYYYRLQVGSAKVWDAEKLTHTLRAPLTLRAGVSYAPYDLLELIKSESGLLDGFSAVWYDENSGVMEKITENEENTLPMKPTNMGNASAVVNDFFKAFEVSDFRSMEDFCTPECVKNYFRFTDQPNSMLANVFDMSWARCTELRVPVSNGTGGDTRTIGVSVVCERPPHSSLLGGERRFWVLLEKQQDGTYLIDSFAN